MTNREVFKQWIESRPKHWERFDEDSWCICSKGCPKEGEYANDHLQQLWECWEIARRMG